MTGRITAAIVGVTAFVLTALGIPLALAVQRSILTSEVVRLEAIASAALVEIEVPLDAAQLRAVADEPDAARHVSVYDESGRLLFGDGPQPMDTTTSAALSSGRVATATSPRLVVASPISDDAEQVVGVVRVTSPRHELDERTRAAWAVMLAAGLVAIAAAWLIARRLARRLGAPLEQLAARADDLIGGVSRDDLPRSGIAEIDQLADALHATSTRVAESLARERQFSADVAHQLRTPLAGARLRLEGVETDASDPRLVADVLADLDRIDATVSHLLAHARDAAPSPSSTPLLPMVEAAAERWRPRTAEAGRAFMVDPRVSGSDLAVASANTVHQILDVLLDNAVRHGSGGVRLVARSLPGGLAVDVTDDGALGADLDEQLLFARGAGIDHGIGLSLARSLAEADGARLLLTSRDPTTFTLFVVAAVRAPAART